MFDRKDFETYSGREADQNLEVNSSGDSESEGFLHRAETPARERRWSALPWITTICFALLSLAELLYFTKGNTHSSNSAVGTYESGWATDFESAKKEIAIEQIRFTGSPEFDENGTYWIPNPSSIKYVGEPSPEIDQNWEEATWGRYFLATEEEARHSFSERYGDDMSWLWNDHAGGYVVGVDMFHTLHCLNRIRKAFYPEYYPENDSYRHRVHRDHCLEQIRQFIMCSGDMTLIPTRYSPFLGHGYVESDVKHTCRSFEPLKNWMQDRYNGTTAVKPVCPHGTYQDLGTRLCRTAD